MKFAVKDPDGDVLLTMVADSHDATPTDVSGDSDLADYAQSLMKAGASVQAIASRMGSYNSLVTVEDVQKDDSEDFCVYALRTHQTHEVAGYVLVKKSTNTMEGFAGQHPPLGYVDGADWDTWQAMNFDYDVETVEEATPVPRTDDDSDGEGDDTRPDPQTVTDAQKVGEAVGSALLAAGVISKAHEEQQIVYGWAYVTHDKYGNLVADKSGDFIDDITEIEKAATGFMLSGGGGDIQHTNIKKADLVESMVFTPEKNQVMGIPDGVLPTGWWVGFKCDDEMWAAYKGGKTSFSIHGSGTRKSVE